MAVPATMIRDSLNGDLCGHVQPLSSAKTDAAQRLFKNPAHAPNLCLLSNPVPWSFQKRGSEL